MGGGLTFYPRLIYVCVPALVGADGRSLVLVHTYGGYNNVPVFTRYRLVSMLYPPHPIALVK